MPPFNPNPSSASNQEQQAKIEKEKFDILSFDPNQYERIEDMPEEARGYFMPIPNNEGGGFKPNQRYETQKRKVEALHGAVNKFLDPDGLVQVASDGSLKKIPAIWDVSGYIFGNEETFFEKVFFSTPETEGFYFDEFIADPNVFDIVKRGILHFITKGHIDSRLVHLIKNLPEYRQKELSPELRTRLEEIIEKDRSFNPDLPVSDDNYKTRHDLSSIHEILKII
ncbi:MAG: hypothetical protein WCK60_01125 [Candidatus Nomurabacteria bacterium]